LSLREDGLNDQRSYRQRQTDDTERSVIHRCDVC